MNKLVYYSLSFLCGASIMMVEMVGFRMLAPYFGYSIYVSGALLSVIMLALSIGYFAGGRWADKTQNDKSLYMVILTSALLVFAIVVFYQPFLNLLLPLSVINGSLLATFVLYTPALFFLSMVSPWLIKILARKGIVGTTAGSVYSISTIGSIFGTLIASFYFIPELGINTTLYLVFGLLLLISVMGLAQYNKAYIVILALIFLPLTNIDKSFAKYPDEIQSELDSGETQVIQDIESQYSRIMTFYYPEAEAIGVRPGFRYFHSIIFKHSLLTGGVWDYYVAAGLAAEPVKNILILGQGSGATYKIFKHIYPNANIVCLDIDEEIIKTGIDFAELKVDDKTSFVIDDARPYLRKTDKKFDLIAIDIFSGGPFVPFYLVTEEFFDILSGALSENGAFAMNINDFNDESLFTHYVMNTAKGHFKSLFYSRVTEDYNTMVFGFKRHITTQAFSQAVKANAHPDIQSVADFISTSIQAFKPDERYYVFTDDKAPVEKIIFDMLQASKVK